MLYITYTYRRQWVSTGQAGITTPKTDLHAKKAMLGLCWRVNEIIHLEILSHGWTITADLCCQRLNRITGKLKEKPDRVH